jgi:murein DD-endopeptidase MepM/ murein hydrolase activator NlpD
MKSLRHSSLSLSGILLLCLTVSAAIYYTPPTEQEIEPVVHEWHNSTVTSERPNLLALKVASGDTMMSILQEAHISNDDIQNVITAIATSYDPKKLHIGQKILLTFDIPADNAPASAETPLQLQSLKLRISPEKEVLAQRLANNSFTLTEIVTPLEKRVIRKQGIITNSLMATVANLDIPPTVMADIVKAYSYNVDFERDIQPGDKFDIVFENQYMEDGTFARSGNVIFSSLTLSDKQYKIYNHTTADGKTDYFDENGFSVRKELLRTPLNIVRISSGFGMRKHPVLGYSKMHKGVDFAASAGTPILAAGNGVVEEIGHKGSYGNYIRIRHNGSQSTAYAHTSRFAKGLHKGDSVKQGDVIAYVGSTGRSTGPHLHFEVLVDNKQVNPLSVKQSPGVKLAGAEMDRFKSYKKKLETLLAQSPDQKELAFDSRSGLKKVN